MLLPGHLAERGLQVLRENSESGGYPNVVGAPGECRVPGLSELSNHRSERPFGPEIVCLMFTQSEVEQFITVSV